MSANTQIEWCHHTFNTHWGCVRVSPGCGGAKGVGGCYAESLARRYGFDVWGLDKPRRFFGAKHWEEPIKWNASAAQRGVRERVFAISMGDILEDRRDLDSVRGQLRALIDATPSLDWLLLSKRPENHELLGFGREWPTNVWFGFTAENQEYFDRRWLIVARSGARTTFCSYEPALGPLELRCEGCGGNVHDHLAPDGGGCSGWFPNWIIAGAESGHGARPMNEDWVRKVRNDCALTSRISFFYKQRLDGRKKVSLPVLDGRQWAEFPKT